MRARTHKTRCTRSIVDVDPGRAVVRIEVFATILVETTGAGLFFPSFFFLLLLVDIAVVRLLRMLSVFDELSGFAVLEEVLSCSWLWMMFKKGQGGKEERVKSVVF